MFICERKAIVCRNNYHIDSSTGPQNDDYMSTSENNYHIYTVQDLRMMSTSVCVLLFGYSSIVVGCSLTLNCLCFKYSIRAVEPIDRLRSLFDKLYSVCVCGGVLLFLVVVGR